MTQARFKLGVVMTHPTQHHGPLWKKLAEHPNFDLKVLYLSNENQSTGDSLLGESSEAWDVNLTEGYNHEYLIDLSGKVPESPYPKVLSPGLFKLIKPKNFDAIYLHSFVNYSYRFAILLCKLRGVPLIMQNDASIMSDARYSRLRLIAMSILYPWMNSLADYWISSGNHNEIHLNHYGVTNDKIVRGCFPVDGERFRKAIDSSPDEVARIRQELSWDDNSILFGFMGKYIERKNPYEFIDAIVLANKQDPRIRGVMFGGGELEKEIEGRIAGLDGEVINYGFINQSKVPLYLAALDSFVSTSWIDPHPLVISEAMASGTPPILSDRCGNWGYSDTVRHRYNGLVYPCGKVEELAKAMLEMADENSRKLYSMRSIEVFEEQDLYCALDAFLEIANRIQKKLYNAPQSSVSSYG